MKHCKLCFQEIDDRAIRCPYCRTWQKKLGILLHHPAVAMVLTAIPLFLVYVMLTYASAKMFDPGESFETHRNSLSVKNTELKFGENSCGSTLVILGEIENQGDVSWKDIQIEASFFNSDGKMIDTDQSKKYSFVVLKNSKSPFKFSIKMEFSQEYYTDYKIKIMTARDMNASF